VEEKLITTIHPRLTTLFFYMVVGQGSVRYWAFAKPTIGFAVSVVHAVGGRKHQQGRKILKTHKRGSQFFIDFRRE
jgi:hypothetical protein